MWYVKCVTWYKQGLTKGKSVFWMEKQARMRIDC